MSVAINDLYGNYNKRDLSQSNLIYSDGFKHEIGADFISTVFHTEINIIHFSQLH